MATNMTVLSCPLRSGLKAWRIATEGISRPLCEPYLRNDRHWLNKWVEIEYQTPNYHPLHGERVGPILGSADPIEELPCRTSPGVL